MTPLYPILLIVVLAAADQGLRIGVSPVSIGPWGVSGLTWGGIVIILGVLFLGVNRCVRSLDAGRGVGAIRTAEILMRWSMRAILLSYTLAVLWLGWLDAVREVTGDLILVDELIATTPGIFGLLGVWWITWPMERRIRETLLMRRLDGARPIYQSPSRVGYVVMQLRTHFLLLFVPVMLIISFVEFFDRFAEWFPQHHKIVMLSQFAAPVTALGVFIVAPLIARGVLDVKRLADGRIHDDLREMCRRHRVRIKEFLLWNTGGSMINAAVMGLIGPLRYVLLTDALVQTVSRGELQAVMAHEIGHVKRHHLPWLLIAFIASLGGAAAIVEWPLQLFHVNLAALSGQNVDTVDLSMSAVVLVLALLMFGWISRRFERQADTFAVQHLTKSGILSDEPENESPAEACREITEKTPSTVSSEAVATMHGTLAAIARLNGVDPSRRSWRHGSITWRQSYLHSIVGRPLDRLAIDRQVRWIKITAAVTILLVVTIGYIFQVYSDRDLIRSSMIQTTTMVD